MRSAHTRLALVVIATLSTASVCEAAFGFRKSLTIDSTRVAGSSDRYGFPVLVSLVDPDLQTNVAHPSGFDIQFRASDGVQILPHEIESWNNATGTLVAWVRLPQISFSVDTVFYIYYGDPGVTSTLEDPTTVWDPTFAGVWHLAEDPSGPTPQLTDSSFYANHGTSGGAMPPTAQVPGIIGGALDFDGANDEVDAGSANSLDDLGPVTVSAWIRPRSAGGSMASTIVSKYGASSAGRWFLETDNTAPEVNAYEFSKNYTSGSVSRTSDNNRVTYNVWQYVTVTWDGSSAGTNVRIFKDGVEVPYQASSSGTPPFVSDAAYRFRLGNRQSGTSGFDGLMDEVRVSNVIRSDDWIQTSYNSQSVPTKDAACTNMGFICVGAQVVQPAAWSDVSVPSGLNTPGAKDGGLAWGDFDNDGCLDVLVNTDTAAGSVLYQQGNAGGCTGVFTDVTACLAPSLSAATLERSAIWGDFDNDGLLDFARNTQNTIEIYRNNGAGAACATGWSLFGAAGAPSQLLDGTSGQPFTFNAEGLGFVDYDRDGDLDLASDQDGGFTIWSNTGGAFAYTAVGGLPATGGGKSDYAAFGDIDGDRDVDILARRGSSPDQYLNDGAGAFTAGTFDESASNGNKGGIALCDFDDDGDFDLFWTDAGVNQIWEQTGVGSGAYAALALPGGIVGDIDGVACGDIDNDSDLDLIVTSDGNDQMFRNDGAFTFVEVFAGTFGADDGEAAAFGDYDRDGDVDLLINQDTANQLWRNETNNNNYLVVRALHDAGGVDRDAIGATLRLLDCSLMPVTGIREVNGGRGHGSQDPAYVHVGLPAGPNASYVVEVRFLDGATVQKAVVPAGFAGAYQLMQIRSTDANDTTACTTSVDLVSFEAHAGDGVVVVEWQTGSEIDNLGFHVLRSSAAGGPYERLTPTLVTGLGRSVSGATYRYTDEHVVNGTTYFYRLDDVETTGAVEHHGPVSATPRDGASLPVAAAMAVPGVRPTGALSASVTVGDPSATTLRMRQRGRRFVDLELRVGGFYATPLEDGSVHLSIPGFIAGDEAASLPVQRMWLAALASKDASVVSVRSSNVETFALRPARMTEADVVMGVDGTVGLSRPRALRQAFRAAGLTPSSAARVVDFAVHRDTKKARVELAPLRWDPNGEQLLLARTLRVRVRFRGPILTPGAAREHDEEASHAPRRVVVRLATTEPGLHAVRYEDVFGARRGRIRSRALRLSRGGETVAFHLAPRRRSFGPGSVLYFVADGGDANPYGSEAVYELSRSARGEIMPVAAPARSAHVVTSYRDRIERHEDRFYLAALIGAEDPWFAAFVLGGKRFEQSFAIDGLAASTEAARIDVLLHGGTDFPASPDHHVRIWVNGVAVAETSWNAKQPRRVSAVVPAGVLSEGTNRLTIENVGDTAAAHSMVLVDRWSLEYPRALTTGDRLDGYFHDGGSVTVPDLGGGFVVDVSRETPVWIPAGSDELSFVARAGHRYVITATGAVRSPQIRAPLASELKRNLRQADYVVVAPRAFRGALEPLLTHRRDQGLSVRFASIEEIFDEFGFGEPDPDAVRAFTSYAYHHWQQPAPRYVLLAGDGSYDYEDVSGLGADHQRVPPRMIRGRYLWTASDPYFAAVNGNDALPDVAIGRLPASSAGEVATMVRKIVEFEEAGGLSMSDTMTLVADDADRAGDFERDADALAAGVLAGRPVEKIYLRQLGAIVARERVADRFDREGGVISYLGHGGIDLWADEQLLTSEAIAAMTPGSRLPIVLTMNCLNGYYHFPFFDSLSEALVKADGRGAIAAFSPSGLSLHGPATELHRSLIGALVRGQHDRLGDAVLAAQETFADQGGDVELLRIYHLLGDPGLRLRR